MKRLIILVLVNLVTFIILRVSTVFIAFYFFGIGASASSQKYEKVIFIPALFIQILLLVSLFLKRKFIKITNEMIGLIAITLIMYLLGHFEVIPF